MKQTGFTLIELIITMTLLTLLGGVVTQMIGVSVAAFTRTSTSLTQINELNTVVGRVGRELRMMGYRQGRYQIHTMSRSHIEFVKANHTRVSIVAHPPYLEMGYSQPRISGVLTNALHDLHFQYYASDGFTEVADSAQVAFVNIVLSLKHEAIIQSLNTRIALRYFGDEKQYED